MTPAQMSLCASGPRLRRQQRRRAQHHWCPSIDLRDGLFGPPDHGGEIQPVGSGGHIRRQVPRATFDESHGANSIAPSRMRDTDSELRQPAPQLALAFRPRLPGVFEDLVGVERAILTEQPVRLDQRLARRAADALGLPADPDGSVRQRAAQRIPRTGVASRACSPPRSSAGIGRSIVAHRPSFPERSRQRFVPHRAPRTSKWSTGLTAGRR